MLRNFLSLLVGLVVFMIMLAVYSLAFAADGGALDAGAALDAGVAPAAVADSAGGGTLNALTRVVEMIFTILIEVVTLFAIWAANKGIRTFEKRVGVDVPAKQEEMIENWIQQAIHFAEEKSFNAIKKKTSKLSGPEKLEEAASYVLSHVENKGWDDWPKEKLTKKIEALLGLHRANGGKPSLDEPEGDPA